MRLPSLLVLFAIAGCSVESSDIEPKAPAAAADDDFYLRAEDDVQEYDSTTDYADNRGAKATQARSGGLALLPISGTTSGTVYTCYRDADRDGHGNPAITSVYFVGSCPVGYAYNANDCDDTDKGDYPGAVEIIGNGDDENCDRAETCYLDGDDDGARVSSGATIASTDTDCGDRFEALSTDPVDCDDAQPSVKPKSIGGVEVTGNNFDDDCLDGALCYVDADDDGARLTSTVASSDSDCADKLEGLATDPIDCDDRTASIKPASVGGVEVPGNNSDEDCTNTVLCYSDDDDDGARLTSTTLGNGDLDCIDPKEGLIADPLDCDDTLASVKPKALGGNEIIGNNFDDDCQDGALCYLDSDDDGSRVDSTTTGNLDGDCGDAKEALASEPLDCDDTSAAIKPAAAGGAEVAGNNLDDDCSGSALCYTDVDNDGARLTSTFASADTDCADPSEGLTADPLDCDDTQAAVRPASLGGAEVTGNNLDDDCSGSALCYTDVDNDGARLATTVASADADCSDPSEGLTADPLDCDDTQVTVKPASLGGVEITGNNFDDDCSAGALCYTDVDNDGARLGTTVVSADSDCADPSEGLTADPLDCDDAVAAVKPASVGGVEITGNNVDDDCSGNALCYVDDDDDGARLASTTIGNGDTDCGDAKEGLTADLLDCDDTSAAVKPGGVEVTGNNVDDDCAGGALCYTDGDNDGARLATTTAGNADGDCSDNNEGLTADPLDCDDAVATTKPASVGGVEITGNNVDDDCAGGALCYTDDDDDGTRLATTTAGNADADCLDTKEGLTADLLDCDDTNAAVKPGGVEITGNNVDDDCAAGALCYTDGDNDGARLATTTAGNADADCSDNNEGLTADPLDCDDAVATTKPASVGGAEITGNNVDDDCAGGALCYTDADDDGARLTTTTAGNADGDCSDSKEGLTADLIDCNDSSAAISPIAAEIVGDGLDQDCDTVDSCYVDADDDSFGTSAVVDSTNLSCGTKLATKLGDCDDNTAAINPSGTEVIGDGKDQDCDNVDACYVDADDDNFGTSVIVDSTNLSCGTKLASVLGDCDDAAASLNPGGTEVVGDGKDQNCDTFDACYVDSDDDGFGTSVVVNSANLTCGTKLAAVLGDCDDIDSADFPGAPEVVGNEDDDNCDGSELCYVDGDADGFGNSSKNTVAESSDSGLTCDKANKESTTATDCNDTVAAINPSATEVCDSKNVDEDCDALADNADSSATGTVTYYLDGDDDGFGATSGKAFCDPDANYPVTITGDCDDKRADTFPGATEIPYDGIDQDCKLGDETDVDNDGYDSTAVSGGKDCDDTNPLVRPGAVELLDGIDNDCNGIPDDNTDASDDDGDGYSDAGGDCDDDDPDVNPDAVEPRECDDIDQDCNGITDDNTDCSDEDGDSYSEDFGDCDDANPDVFPGQIEDTTDGIDNDCDGITDEGGANDPDSDGFTVAGGDCAPNDGTIFPGAVEVENGKDDDCNDLIDDQTDAYDDDGDGFTENEGDCADSDETANPDATEVEDGVDNNCDGKVDEGTDAYDDDGDGYTETGDDCDDDDASIHPGEPEVVNGVDDNCDGEIDEGFGDEDGDGQTTADGDCDDNDPERFLGAVEVCDGVDNNCSGDITDETGCDEAPAGGCCSSGDASTALPLVPLFFALLGLRRRRR